MKRELRSRLLTARRARRPDGVATAADALCAQVLALPELPSAGCVAAYVSVGGEPGTGPLLDALRERGIRVLLPVLLPDDDLSWAEDTGERTPAERGLLEPVGQRLGVDAVGDADLVLVPGLAVGADGLRLGRGGGSYDRALARVAPDTPVAVLLYDDELLDAVPAEPHDHPVSLAVTPARVLRFSLRA
ncbi:5-formyltetrahydrofolate cyclo-ligase [Nocardioides daejeonensis]|uniref:5-formyltetrahydrofolate cyclo-ligase n=1 Tax=Nocardioides daejeonensis TaxID=1046556 RepID=UPI000D7443E8|nr:5-formyltetrahydrofolate cyclo-ligase [Nocardioides daejeonensis]